MVLLSGVLSLMDLCLLERLLAGDFHYQHLAHRDLVGPVESPLNNSTEKVQILFRAGSQGLDLGQLQVQLDVWLSDTGHNYSATSI